MNADFTLNHHSYLLMNDGSSKIRGFIKLPLMTVLLFLFPDYQNTVIMASRHAS